MAKHLPTEDCLDKKSRERLDKLESQWSEPCDAMFLKELKLPDLKLLLEHFTPLRDLIRALVATPEGASPSALAQETASLRDQASAAQTAQDSAEAALTSTQAELAQAHERCRAAERDLSQCSAKVKELLKENSSQQQTIQRLEKQCQQAQNALSAAQAQLARSGTAPAELALLRQDTALAQAVGLESLPSDDTQALIQTVAVLSQRDNLERLWNTLKDRCEDAKRPATAGENALLQAALAWHNHNWRTRPYRLIEAAPASAYNFECHQRSRHTNTGETVAAQHLPGIADGSGRPLCKALVHSQ